MPLIFLAVFAGAVIGAGTLIALIAHMDRSSHDG